MLIFTDYNRVYSLESPTSPVIVKNYWIFNANQLDYTLAPMNYLEETIGTVVEIEIMGTRFKIPYGWYILISDEETMQLDSISVSSCITSNSSALLMTAGDLKFRVTDINIIGIEQNVSITHPLLHKNTALCHPVGKVSQDNKEEVIASMVIGPHDIFKFLSDKTYADLI